MMADTYTVQQGDTLSAIARRRGMALQDLLNANPGIESPDLINVGQEISFGDDEVEELMGPPEPKVTRQQMIDEGGRWWNRDIWARAKNRPAWEDVVNWSYDNLPRMMAAKGMRGQEDELFALMADQWAAEGSAAGQGRSPATNPGNVYEYDEGTKRTFDTLDQGLAAHANTLLNEYLTGGRTTEDLRKKFTRPRDEARYASDTNYETLLGQVANMRNRYMPQGDWDYPVPIPFRPR